MIKIVVDSTAYLTKEFMDKYGIAMAPQNTFLNGVHDVEGVPGEFTDYFDRLTKAESFPKTSQPSPERFYDAYLPIMQDPENEIICITSSSGISGTYGSACIARDMFSEEDRKRISVIDSLCAVQLIWTLVKTMLKLIDDGWDRERIVAFIEKEKLRGRAFLIPYNLEYLKRGGRLSGASALIGTILNIKPVIELNNGRLSTYKKVMGFRNALIEMVKIIPDNAYNIGTAFVYSQEKEYNLLVELLQKRFPDKQLNLHQEIGTVIGSHLGPHAFGVMFFDPNKETENSNGEQTQDVASSIKE